MEARFYFRAKIAGIIETLVLCSLYSYVDVDQNRHSCGALDVVEYYGTDNLIVIRATDVLSVVAMIPFRTYRPDHAPEYFIIEKFALGICIMEESLE